MSTESQYQVVPLRQLHESPLNPRKTYSAKAMEDLTASVRAKGVITPLLVRPREDGIFEDDGKGRTRVREDLNGHPGFEIAAGHRRYRAAQAAGLEAVPAVVRPMDDVTFLEVLIMENDEREDLHPLEEAQGYKTLMTKAGYTVERIAERRGGSVKYIYDRVKLLELIPEAQALFREGRFTAGHAILLARLKPADQKRALDPDKGGLFQREHLLWDPADEARVRGRAVDQEPLKAASVRELEAWIDEHVRFDVKAVDPMLFPETAAVVDQVVQESDKLLPITYEHYIQPEARLGRTLIQRSWRRADGQLKSKPCDKAVMGIVVVGPSRGEAFKICVDKKGCAVHWGAEQREAKRRAASADRTGGTTQDRYAREQAKAEAERARIAAEHARWKKATPAILEAMAAAVKKAPTKANGLLGSIVAGAFALSWGHKDYSSAHVPRGTTAEDLVRHCAFLVLQDELQEFSAPVEFPKRAKAFGIDVRKIVDAAAPTPAAEAKEAAKKAKKK